MVQPEGVSKEEAAIASDAGITAYNAVKNTAGVRSSVFIFMFIVNNVPRTFIGSMYSWVRTVKERRYLSSALEVWAILPSNTQNTSGLKVCDHS